MNSRVRSIISFLRAPRAPMPPQPPSPTHPHPPAQNIFAGPAISRGPLRCCWPPPRRRRRGAPRLAAVAAAAASAAAAAAAAAVAAVLPRPAAAAVAAVAVAAVAAAAAAVGSLHPRGGAPRPSCRSRRGGRPALALAGAPVRWSRMRSFDSTNWLILSANCSARNCSFAVGGGFLDDDRRRRLVPARVDLAREHHLRDDGVRLVGCELARDARCVSESASKWAYDEEAGAEPDSRASACGGTRGCPPSSAAATTPASRTRGRRRASTRRRAAASTCASRSRAPRGRSRAHLPLVLVEVAAEGARHRRRPPLPRRTRCARDSGTRGASR